MRRAHAEGYAWNLAEKKKKKTVENGKPQAHKHAQQRTQHIITYTQRCVCQLVANSTVYIYIYIYSFFSVVFCVFLLFIFRIVKQLAALLDTSRVRCFDKTWLKAAKGKCPLERRVLPSLLQCRVQRGARNTSFALYHIYFGIFIMLNVDDSTEHVFHLSSSWALHSTTRFMAKTVGQTQTFGKYLQVKHWMGGYGYRFTVAARLGYPYHFKQRQHPNLALMLIKIVWAPSPRSVPSILRLAFS